MKSWIQKNRLSLMLHLFAVTVSATIAIWGVNGIEIAANNPQAWLLERSLATGKWAIRFLILSLAITPLNRYLGWRWAIRHRKPAGLWAFAFATLHVFFILTDGSAGWGWFTWPIQPFVWLGLIGLVTLTAMALTSNRKAMQLLQKTWKRLHRLIYGAAILIGIHGIMATQRSKKILIFDSNARIELTIYLALIAILLALRLKNVFHYLSPASSDSNNTRNQMMSAADKHL